MLELLPISFKEAQEFVKEYHRHNGKYECEFQILKQQLNLLDLELIDSKNTTRIPKININIPYPGFNSHKEFECSTD